MAHLDQPALPNAALGTLTSADDLLQARLAGRISRRGMLARAAELGLASGVGAILLMATGERAPAASAPVPAERGLAPAGRPISGGKVVAGVVGAVDTLNPYTCDLYGPTFDILSGVMDGLLRFDSRQRIRPSLAESYEISDDGLRYTFRLRPRVTFHNGDPLTAADVVASWQMLINQDLPVFSRLGWDRIAAIDVPDPATVVITTDQLFAPFLGSIATGQQTASVICPARHLATTADFIAQFETKPIGTGPYRLKSFGGGVATLERYDKHWGGRPRLDQIQVRCYDDHPTMLRSLGRGKIHVAARTGGPGVNNLDVALAIEGATVLAFPGQTWGHLDLKQVGPLRETRVRQALDYATPKDRIIDRVLGGQAVRAVADQSPAGGYLNRAITPRPLDLDKAGSLLRRAGFTIAADGVWARGEERLAIELWGERADPDTRRVLRLIAGSWAELGVETTVNVADAEELWGPDGYQFTDRPTAGYYRWANTNDPDNMYYWHSSQIPATPNSPGGNVPAFPNPYAFQEEIDELTSRAAAETDPDARRQLYLDIQALLHREVPALFLFWDTAYAVADARVGGYWPGAPTYLLWDAREWYLTR